MLQFKPWLALSIALLGNCGFWLFCFNRVNAFGFRRPVAKLLEKMCILLCFSIPIFLAWTNLTPLTNWINGQEFWPAEANFLLTAWLVWTLAAAIVLGPLWIESRLWLIPPHHLVASSAERYNIDHQLPTGSANNFSTRCHSLIPLNEWAELEVTRKRLRLPRSLPAADGLTIGHLSDLHFTGQYRDEHYHYVVDCMMRLSPELIVISGDIIDFAHCLPMVPKVLGRLSAPLGVYFVLGNHDQRLRDTEQLVRQLTDLGFHDLGTHDCLCSRGSLIIQLSGNELPWFQRHSHPPLAPRPNASPEVLRIGVAHSPDSIRWARQANQDLLLAGHTHGGQVRLPLIGPLVAPSLYGSKFASGLFWLPPTLMHVSRGVAGTHPLRWRCPPEISLLIVQSAD